MKLIAKWWVLALFSTILAVCGNIPVFADTYHIADFSGGIHTGKEDVKNPFKKAGFFHPGDTLTGSFVYDDQKIKIPEPGKSAVNVFFSTYPDIAVIPAATAFRLTLDALTFDLSATAPNSPNAIQYDKHGHFKGFALQADFSFLGQQYRFDNQGGTWRIKLLDQHGNPTGGSLVEGFINIGDKNLTGIQPYNPAAVPLPGSVWLLGTCLLGLAGLRLGRKS